MENASIATRTAVSRRDLSTAKSVRLGQIRVDLKTWEVSRQGHRSRLQEKPFRVLEALIERPGELITRSELRQRLWPDGTVVDFDNNLNSAVATLRMAFGDTAKAPRVIETLPRLGYRLVAEVSFDDPARRLDRRWLVAATAVVLVLLALGVRERLGARVNQSADAARLEPAESEVSAPEDPVARQAWQKGLYLFSRGSVGDLALALESFEETRRKEPRFAPAHVKAAETLMRMSFSGSRELREGFIQVQEAAGRALSLDPESANAHRLQALADLHVDWDFEAAGKAIESALRLDPKDAQNYLAAATFLSASRRREAAVLAARRAVALDPASSLLRADLGYFLLAAGRYDEALTLTEELLEIEPKTIHLLASHLLAAERLGLLERSLTMAKRTMELGGADEAEIRNLTQGSSREGLIHFRSWRLTSFRASGHPSFFQLAVRQAAFQQKEAALDSLYQAHERREAWLVYLHSQVRFDGLHDDPRFIALVRKLGFPQPTDAVVARVESLL